MMKRFQDKIYALSQKGLLLWEPSWETFRPVVAVVWNPAHNQLEPYFGIYTNDIFDVDYGFGDSKMHDFCIEFTDENAYDVGGAEEVTNVLDLWKWCGSKVQWIGDQWLTVHPCGVLDRKQYLKRFNLRAKTCRRKAPRNLHSTRKVNTH